MLFRTIAKSLVGVLAFFTITASVLSDTRPAFVDIPSFASALDQSLAQGVASANQTLARLGPDVSGALADAQSKTDFNHQFSAETSVRMLYERAELQQAGQGDLFLARLKASLARNSAAVAEDPRLKYLDN